MSSARVVLYCVLAMVLILAISVAGDKLAYRYQAFPSGPEWEEHRNKAASLEKRIMESTDEAERERLRLEHRKHNDEWLTYIRNNR